MPLPILAAYILIMQCNIDWALKIKCLSKPTYPSGCRSWWCRHQTCTSSTGPTGRPRQARRSPPGRGVWPASPRSPLACAARADYSRAQKMWTASCWSVVVRTQILVCCKRVSSAVQILSTMQELCKSSWSVVVRTQILVCCKRVSSAVQILSTMQELCKSSWSVVVRTRVLVCCKGVSPALAVLSCKREKDRIASGCSVLKWFVYYI